MGKILNGPDGTRTPWAESIDDGLWHFRPADDWWETQADVQAHGRCGVAFASVHVSTFWPGHLRSNSPDMDIVICDTCSALWAEQEAPRLAQSVLDGLGPLYLDAIAAAAPANVREAFDWLKAKADRRESSDD